MLSKTIELTVSKGEFLFTDGLTVCRFRPVIFITDEKKILSIGDPPATPFEARRINIFEDVDTDALELLESLLRYGMRETLGGFTLRSIVLRITISNDIQAEFKGFTNLIFRHAATLAGASKIII